MRPAQSDVTHSPLKLNQTGIPDVNVNECEYGNNARPGVGKQGEIVTARWPPGQIHDFKKMPWILKIHDTSKLGMLKIWLKVTRSVRTEKV